MRSKFYKNGRVDLDAVRNSEIKHRTKSTLKAKRKPLKKVSAHAIKKALDAFKSQLNIGEGSDIDFVVFDTQTEAFGPDATIEKEGRLLGGYDPATNRVIIIAEHTESVQDAIKTFRHEVLGHYGFDLFEPGVKKQILDRILESRSVPGLRKIWKDIDKRYQDKDDYQKAEEVFAKIAEDKQARLSHAWHKVMAFIAKQLRKIGLLQGQVTKSELIAMVEQIAKGIKAGASRQSKPMDEQGIRHRVAPETNDALKKRAQKTLKQFNNWIDSFGPLGKLPGRKRYLAMRYRALGKLAEIEKLGREIYDVFSEATPEDSKAIYDFLTTKDGLDGEIKDDALRRAAIDMKNTITAIGEKMVERGLLDRDVFESNKGAYLHFIKMWMFIPTYKLRFRLFLQNLYFLELSSHLATDLSH